jgi:hypothetical protein
MRLFKKKNTEKFDEQTWIEQNNKHDEIKKAAKTVTYYE